jgi:Tol biopolymer transport system component
LASPVNSDHHDIFPSVAKDGTIYFFSERDGGLGMADLYRSKPIEGSYTKVENLGVPINTNQDEIDPFIAPDESYLIFCSKARDGYGEQDLFISFKKPDGSWTEPANMGESINSSGNDWIPFVTPDNKYFFFGSNRNGQDDIFWVDARVVEKSKPDFLK